jgi:hypothetical protein
LNRALDVEVCGQFLPFTPQRKTFSISSPVQLNLHPHPILHCTSNRRLFIVQPSLENNTIKVQLFDPKMSKHVATAASFLPSPRTLVQLQSKFLSLMESALI